MKLNLKRPLIIFDLETTGVNVTQDHIVEIGYIPRKVRKYMASQTKM